VTRGQPPFLTGTNVITVSQFAVDEPLILYVTVRDCEVEINLGETIINATTKIDAVNNIFSSFEIACLGIAHLHYRLLPILVTFVSSALCAVPWIPRYKPKQDTEPPQRTIRLRTGPIIAQ
jgi:hypothetical protein